jgi:hypothetical protein
MAFSANLDAAGAVLYLRNGSLIAVPFTGNLLLASAPRHGAGRIGKQVKILCGSAAVTDDESSRNATVRKRGKAEPVG